MAKIYQWIETRSQNGVFTLTLNRPEVLNALNMELACELVELLEKAKQDLSVKILILRGKGDCFSAGGDLKHFHDHLDQAPEDFLKMSAYLNQAISLIVQMEKPVLAAVTGPAYAAGLGLVLSCDLILASSKATFSPSFIKVGLAPNASTTFFLPRILGPKRAMESFLKGQVFSSQEALRLGLVNQVWPSDAFETELSKYVTDLLSRSSEVLGKIKKLLTCSLSSDLPSQVERERQEISHSAGLEGFKKGVKAFVEKKKS